VWTPEGRARIDLSLNSIDELYSPYDHAVCHPNRNLDPSLVDYLVACAKELDPHEFEVWLHMGSAPDDDLRAAGRQSLRHYFSYRLELEQRSRRRRVLRAVATFGAGASLLVSITAFGSPVTLFSSVTTQGLTVAAWLLLWDSLAVWLLERSVAGRAARVLLRLREARVRFLDDEPEG